MALFRWFILRRLRAEPVRTMLTVAGIALGVGVVLRDDGLGVTRAEAGDVIERALETGDDAHGQDAIEKFGAPVGVGRALGGRNERTRPLVAA